LFFFPEDKFHLPEYNFNFCVPIKVVAKQFSPSERETIAIPQMMKTVLIE
jgi:hypothetical protein